MKRILTICALILTFCISAVAQGEPQQTKNEDTYQIIKDEIVDGIRYVSAAPSKDVCAKLIDITIKKNIIQEVKFTRGCPGNALGVGALIKGMTIKEAIKRLDGIPCGKKSTSCPDQLAQVLKSLK